MVDAGQRFVIAQDGPAQGLAGEAGRGKDLRDQILGRILIHTDLLQHNAPLQLQLPLGKDGMQHHIAQKVCRRLHMGVQRAGVKAGMLLGVKSVHLSADHIKGLGQLGGGAGLRPLEEHMLDEMGHAGQLVRLMAAAVFHPDADGAGADVVQRLIDHPDAVGKKLFFYHNRSHPFCRAGRTRQIP